MTRTALILAGHGSHISPETAGIVWEQVDALRKLNVADEVTAAFWKEAPAFQQVIGTLAADDITIVPLFTAQGYFTQSVIPAEMGLSGSVTERDGKIIRYAPTLSEHPGLATIVQQQVETALAQSGADPAETAVVIIGHGTRRSPESRKATTEQAALVREMVAESLAVFLDDAPSIPDMYSLTNANVIIAVPFFLALGSHTTIDVPGEIGLKAGETVAQINGRQVYYTLPVGVGGDLEQMILEIARGAGAPLRAPTNASVWDGYPSVGRDELIEAVRENGWIEFGELTLSLHEVRPTEMDLEAEIIIELNHPAALRNHVRRSPFRPLATSADLPRDWVMRVEKRAQLHAVVETVYPGAAAEWARRGSLPVTTLDTLAERQTGQYRPLGKLSDEQRAELVTSMCGHCVRQPTWFNGLRAPLPCAEACNWWMSRALEAYKQEVDNE